MVVLQIFNEPRSGEVKNLLGLDAHIATRNLSVSQNLNKFLTSPLRGSLKICNTTTIIFRNMPVLPGNPADFPGEQGFYEV